MGDCQIRLATLAVAALACLFALLAFLRAGAALDAAQMAAARPDPSWVGGDVQILMDALIDAGVIRDPYAPLAERTAEEQRELWCTDAWPELAIAVFPADASIAPADDTDPFVPRDPEWYAWLHQEWSSVASPPFAELTSALRLVRDAHREFERALFSSLDEDLSPEQVRELAEAHLGGLADEPAVAAAIAWSEVNCS